MIKQHKNIIHNKERQLKKKKLYKIIFFKIYT